MKLWHVSSKPQSEWGKETKPYTWFDNDKSWHDYRIQEQEEWGDPESLNISYETEIPDDMLMELTDELRHVAQNGSGDIASVVNAIKTAGKQGAIFNTDTDYPIGDGTEYVPEVILLSEFLPLLKKLSDRESRATQKNILKGIEQRF
jgi:hypothetical protein